MKAPGLTLVVLLSVVAQVALARFAVTGTWVFDLVVVGVVYAGLTGGPVAGMLAGTFGGLTLDLISGGVVGIGSLAKTLTGFAAGIVGTHFVLHRSHGRTLIVVLGTLGHRALVLALYGLIDQDWPSVSWAAILTETSLNALCALVAFQAGLSLPGRGMRDRTGRRAAVGRRPR